MTVIQKTMSAGKSLGRIFAVFIRYKNVIIRFEAVMLLLYVDNLKDKNPTTWRQHRKD